MEGPEPHVAPAVGAASVFTRPVFVRNFLPNGAFMDNPRLRRVQIDRFVALQERFPERQRILADMCTGSGKTGLACMAPYALAAAAAAHPAALPYGCRRVLWICPTVEGRKGKSVELQVRGQMQHCLRRRVPQVWGSHECDCSPSLWNSAAVAVKGMLGKNRQAGGAFLNYFGVLYGVNGQPPVLPRVLELGVSNRCCEKKPTWGMPARIALRRCTYPALACGRQDHISWLFHGLQEGQGFGSGQELLDAIRGTDIVVATPQYFTVRRYWPPFRTALDALRLFTQRDGPLFDLHIYDECHYLPTPSWNSIWEALRGPGTFGHAHAAMRAVCTCSKAQQTLMSPCLAGTALHAGAQTRYLAMSGTPYRTDKTDIGRVSFAVDGWAALPWRVSACL